MDIDESEFADSESELTDSFSSVYSACSYFSTSYTTEEESADITPFFDYLSDEVILEIFYWLPKRKLLLDVALVCRRWHRLTQDATLWTRLDLSRCCLNHGALGYVITKQVTVLRLAYSQIDDPVFLLSYIKAENVNFKAKLSYLDLTKAHISYDGLITLFSICDSLTKVSLSGVAVNDDVLKELSGNKQLEVLNLSLSFGIAFEGLVHLLNGCLNLIELSLAWTTLTRDALQYACTHFPSTLMGLDLTGRQLSVYDSNIKDIVKRCPNLRVLRLSDCPNLSSQAIDYITELQHLNYLDLARCSFEEIPYLSLLQLKRISSLIYLNIHGAQRIYKELRKMKQDFGHNLQINQLKVIVAAPTVEVDHPNIWGCSLLDWMF